MKKSLLAMLLAIAFAVPALADNMWVAGSFGYSNRNESGRADKTTTTSTVWSVEPEFGFVLSEKWSMGLIASYMQGQSVEEFGGFEFEDYFSKIEKDDMNVWGVAPFVKYKIFKTGNFTIFAKGKIFYNNIRLNKNNTKINSFGASITPVIDYALTEKWSLCAALNFASIGYIYSKSYEQGGPSVSEFGLNAGQGSLFNVGVVYHF